MVHDSIWNPSQLVSMNDLEQLSGEGFDDLFSYSSSPEARSPTNVASQQPGMFRFVPSFFPLEDYLVLFQAWASTNDEAIPTDAAATSTTTLP